MQNEALQLLFNRPSDPLFASKQWDSPLQFKMPDHFYDDRYSNMIDDINTEYEPSDDYTVFDVQNIDIPDLNIPLQLKRDENFTLLLPSHKEMATTLIDLFMNQQNVEDLLSLAAYCRDRVNPYLFNYALSVAMLHREDTKEISVPNFLQVFPGKFVDSGIFSQVRQEVGVVPQDKREAVVLAREFTANSKEPEQKVAYFREDLGINLHHWHWHLVYPTEATDITIVDKDRRGELFYYMNQQIMARYNIERFANDMGYCKPYSNFKDPIPEGYFPKLEMQVASRSWPPRFINITPSDINRSQNQLEFNLTQMETWQRNVMEAIEGGNAVDSEGNEISLLGDKGIDILGNILQASMLSPNLELYGSIHNMGHMIVALCHDPDGRYLESFAVLGDTATAMRDPMFYRLHTYFNNLCVTLKSKLAPYTATSLNFKNVLITDIQIHSKDKPDNEFHTFWQQIDIDMSKGIDFTSKGSAKVRFTHLQHTDFTYNIKIKNTSKKQLLGFMRIFMAPHFNDAGEAMTFEEQRKLMIELDRFKVTIKKGLNTITRKSLESSVTIPYDRTFRSLNVQQPAEEKTVKTFNFCGCGWPQHMLIPRGTEKGMLFDLFVMVSDYNQDNIDQDISGICNDAESYCGIQGKMYPDKKPMGYPFDRLGRHGAEVLSKFLTPNMKTTEVKVIFTDRIEVIGEINPIAPLVAPVAGAAPSPSGPAQPPNAGPPLPPAGPPAPVVVPAKP